MKKLITAIVLTDNADVTPNLSDVTKLVHVSKFNTLDELHKQRLLSIRKVTTPYFIFVDSDDYLLEGYGDTLGELVEMMMKSRYSIGYTDYRIINTDNANEIRDEIIGPFDKRNFYSKIDYLHHSVLVKTSSALQLSQRLPQGNYWTNYLLYAPLSRIGASYVNKICYVWNMQKQVCIKLTTRV